MKKTVWFDIACNDPDNGVFAGHANMIHYRWGNEYIEIESKNWDGFTFSRGDGWIRLHRRKFAIIGTKGWVGNWCWDAYRMRRPEAKRFLAMLKASGNWSCTQGASRWFDWFNGATKPPHLVNCIDCKEPFDISGGYILMHMCPSCLAKPKKPDAFIERNGLLVPNPDGAA